jgi:hypothetical protein
MGRYVDETEGQRSATDHLNELLRRAVLQEQYDRLEAEATEFFVVNDTAGVGLQPLKQAFVCASLTAPSTIAFASISFPLWDSGLHVPATHSIHGL